MRIAAVALLAAAAVLSACKAEPAPVAAPAPAPAPADAGVKAPEAAPAAAEAYPLDTCPVSGEKLGSMGDPVVVSHEGVEVRLCCKGCLKEFNADPKKFADIVTAARKK